MFSIYIIILWVVLVAIKPSRKLALALTPWLIFACSYDAMRLYPNYEVNPIDVRGIYDAEKSLFGITTAGGTLIPGEWFNLHHHAFLDFMAGIFYLCWVPVPMAFALFLYFKGKHEWYLRFSLAFLFVNLVGFIGYYIYPAAPPWYAINYGFEPILNTPGNVAGLLRFDNLLGVPVFQSIYGNNSNVFAAVPSLHAAYMLVTTIYAVASKQRKWLIAMFAFICVGIWWTAVYSTHHYIIDVVLGIATTFVALMILEYGLLRIKSLRSLLNRYIKAI